MFKLWSESHPESKKRINPDLGIRSWDELSRQEKDAVMEYFQAKGWMKANDRSISAAVRHLMEEYKKEVYCPAALATDRARNRDDFRGPDLYHYDFQESARRDFIEVWHRGKDVVYDMLSAYAQDLSQRDSNNFKKFCACFNDIFRQFCLDVLITEDGLMPFQAEEITEEVYVPVFKLLNDAKWKPVNDELSGAFENFRKGSYETCITKLNNVVQAFLQILVHGKVGKGDISKLIPEAQKQGLIPTSPFTAKFVDVIEGHLGRERAQKSDSHPKQEEASAADAKFLMNLVMVVLQYWLQR